MNKMAMKIKLFAIFWMMLLFSLWSKGANASFTKKVMSERVEQGNVLYRYSHFFDNQIPLSIHIVDIDPKFFDLRLEPAITAPISGESLPSFVKRTHAFAAINGGFFYINGKLPAQAYGAVKINGNWLSIPPVSSGAIGWDINGNFIFGRIQMNWFINFQDTFYNLDRFNMGCGANQIAFFNDRASFASAKFGRGKFIELDDQFGVRRQNLVRPQNLPNKVSMLFIGENHALRSRLAKTKDKITPYYGIIERSVINGKVIDTQPWQYMDNILGAGNILIEQSIPATDYTLETNAHNKNTIPDRLFPIYRSFNSPNFSLKQYNKINFPQKEVRESALYKLRHPRSVIATRKIPNTVISLIVVEGRQPAKSIGMTGRELSEFLKEIGCINGINLDGGFSSGLYFGSEICAGLKDTSPKGNGDWRGVSNAIIVLPKNK